MSAETIPARGWRLQEVTNDGAPILPAFYATRAEAIAAGRYHGARIVARRAAEGFEPEPFRVDVIGPSEHLRETAWPRPDRHPPLTCWSCPGTFPTMYDAAGHERATGHATRGWAR